MKYNLISKILPFFAAGVFSAGCATSNRNIATELRAHEYKSESICPNGERNSTTIRDLELRTNSEETIRIDTQNYERNHEKVCEEKLKEMLDRYFSERLSRREIKVEISIKRYEKTPQKIHKKQRTKKHFSEESLILRKHPRYLPEGCTEESLILKKEKKN
ncbi:MAG: hypothetical protein ABIH25_02940 [Candidatus Woesearchaeota archaeon]